MVLGAGWSGARAFTSTSGPGISLMNELLGLGVLHRDSRGHHRRAARRALDRHADADPAGRHLDVRLRLPRRHEAHPALSRRIPTSASSSPSQSFDLAERFQTPVFMLSDLDIGMNDWVVPKLTWDDDFVPDRGRVLRRRGPRRDRRVLPLHRRRRGVRHAAHAARLGLEGRVLHPRLGPRQVRPLHRDPRPVPRGHRPAEAEARRRGDPRARAGHRASRRRDASASSRSAAATSRCARRSTSSSSAASSRTSCACAASRSSTTCATSSRATSAASSSSRTATRSCAP